MLNRLLFNLQKNIIHLFLGACATMDTRNFVQYTHFIIVLVVRDAKMCCTFGKLYYRCCLLYKIEQDDGIRWFICFPYFLQVVTSLADPSANIIFGAVVDERYNGEIHVTIIATGFTQSFQKTLLTDPRGAKLLADKAGGNLRSPLTLNSSPSPVTAQAPTRRLFF